MLLTRTACMSVVDPTQALPWPGWHLLPPTLVSCPLALPPTMSHSISECFQWVVGSNASRLHACGGSTTCVTKRAVAVALLLLWLLWHHHHPGPLQSTPLLHTKIFRSYLLRWQEKEVLNIPWSWTLVEVTSQSLHFVPSSSLLLCTPCNWVTEGQLWKLSHRGRHFLLNTLLSCQDGGVSFQGGEAAGKGTHCTGLLETGSAPWSGCQSCACAATEVWCILKVLVMWTEPEGGRWLSQVNWLPCSQKDHIILLLVKDP